MTAKLIAEEGVLKGQEIDLTGRDEWVIGRDPEVSQIVLEDPTVSRQHLICRQTIDGFQVENLSTSNPAELNDAPLQTPHLLQNGDSVKIGSSYWRFFSEEAITTTPPLEKETEATEQQTTTTAEDEEEISIFEEEEGDLLGSVDLDLTDNAPWLLKVVAGPNNGAQFSMYTDTSYIIGTDPASCDIVFHDVSVSRQHARLTIGREGELTIEDLKSSNGTMIDSIRVEEKQQFQPNTLISTGSTSFVVYNREGERKTIISPLLPSIVKLLQKEEKRIASEQAPPPPVEAVAKVAPPLHTAQHKKHFKLFVLIFAALIGTSLYLLFKPEEIVKEAIDTNKVLEQTISPFQKIRFAFNPSTGRLLVVGHVLTNVDHEQLLYDIKALGFVKNTDDYIVVDENIWRETNLVLGKNPNWKGVTVHSPSPGKFVISGYIQTRKEADSLSDYLAQNFPYIDLLEQNIFVEEDVINRAKILLLDAGLQDISVKISAGDVILSGNVPFGERPTLDAVIAKLKLVPGVRDIKPYVSETAPADTLIDLTKDYPVSGVLKQPSGKISVVILGKILSEGDSLDGKTITKIESNTIYLEDGGLKYRIEYNR